MDFQRERVLNNLRFLTSEATSGRLSGTVGAGRAAEYLATQLEAVGYSASGTQGYFEPVEVPATRLVGQATLRIGDRTYEHRKEFAELLMVSGGGDLEADLLVMKDGDNVDSSLLSGKVVLIPERPDGFDLRGTVEAAVSLGIKGILLENGSPQWFRKTLFGSKSNQIPVLGIQSSLVEELMYANGVPVKIKLPIRSDTIPCLNVLGVLGDSSSKPTVLLSARYDHLGDDPNGHRFPGAIDNASGVAIILEAARVLSANYQSLPYHVAVAFLTGEESNLWGARKLVDHPPFAISAAINVDSLGFEPELVAMRVGHATPGHWLPDLAAQIIEEAGVQVKWIAGGDDSHTYLTNNIPALGLGQKPTMASAIKIHTPEDTLSALHMQPLEKGFSILMEILRHLEHSRFLGVPLL